MRVDNDSVSRIPSVYTRPQNWEGPQRHVISGAALRRDAVTLSGAGLARANLRARDEISLWGTGAASSDPAIKLMEESVAEVGNLMEEMRTLSRTAEDEALTDLDRIDLQIDMQRLQNQLAKATRTMSLRMSGASEGEIAKMFLPEFLENNGVDQLMRARERILNGEKWDVAEEWEMTFVQTEMRVVTPEGMRIIPREPDGSFNLSKNIDPDTAVIAKGLEPIGGEFKTTGREDVPTLSEHMQQNNAIILMDAGSAKGATKRLDAELTALLELRDEMREISAEAPAQTTPLTAEPIMTEADIDALLGSIHTEEQQKSEDIQKEQDNLTTGGPAYEDGADVNAHIKGAGEIDFSPSEQQRIQTPLGAMLYTVKENGKLDMTDPRLVTPQGKKGQFFAKLERFFKDRIAANLGTPFGGAVTFKAAPMSTKIV